MDNTEFVKEDRRKKKTENSNPVEYAKLISELRIETARAKQKFINETCVEITKLQQSVRYDLVYQKAKELGWKENPEFGIEDTRGHFATNRQQIHKICDDYIK